MHNGFKYGLTEKQQLIFNLYFNEGLSQKVIASRLQISQPAVCKLIKKAELKKSSAGKNHTLKTEDPRVAKGGLYNLAKIWRFHALQFIIKPYYCYPRYFEVLKNKGNYGIQHSQFTITLYNDSVRIQSAAGAAWRDADKYKAITKGEADFNDFLIWAAKAYGFEYYKEGRVAIKLVSSELALENSEFSQDYQTARNENTLIIKDKDGKVYFLIDQSTGTPEHEYIGKNTFSNSERLEPYINDLVLNQPFTNSQLTSRLGDTVTAIEKLKDLVEILVKNKIE